ncbi:hypothetical protein L1987_20668 [Smallanthus sonchifolius]|uniref:Uncharacterized protein n=1 Tax=Smallanthus sonchifolius TaxID=185202 RepID=A0ACB9IT19_9ASTR|nr:hypothetical protein L1987_20668 [Smallanthus sonchifolius]
MSYRCAPLNQYVYADGSICLDILQNQWSPIYDVPAILTSIQSLFCDLNPNSPALYCYIMSTFKRPSYGSQAYASYCLICLFSSVIYSTTLVELLSYVTLGRRCFRFWMESME